MTRIKEETKTDETNKGLIELADRSLNEYSWQNDLSKENSMIVWARLGRRFVFTSPTKQSVPTSTCVF